MDDRKELADLAAASQTSPCIKDAAFPIAVLIDKSSTNMIQMRLSACRG